MALELHTLAQAVDDLSANAAQRLADLDRRLPAIRALLKTIGVAGEELRANIQAALRARWAGAIPTAEAVDAAYPPPPLPARVNILAADGSQIYPDRHGVALYYLINIGSIVFGHGSGEAPRTRSKPEVFFQDADLYEEDGGQIPVQQIDMKRDQRELAELAQLAEADRSVPTVALLDNGLLLYYSLQAPSREQIAEALGPYLKSLDRLKACGAAVAGVVARPRSAGVARLLHLSTLARDEIDRHAELFQSSAAFRQVTDFQLFDFLQPGERSAIFESGSPANLDHYQKAGHSIHFFYLNAGRPGKDSLLRIEVPEWVARDIARLNLVHAAIVEQCRITDGFPYVLMRAHELAVVTVAERREFEQMVTGALVRRGLTPSVSQKAQGKAWTATGKRWYP
ncbi:MAG: DNA double-strand break repair nuclease NurA [Anaerolineales bacterium]|nr:DNA double-strand break repair nuclease NurA [Anaerolineales bacterium]